MENSAPPNHSPTVAYEGFGQHRPYKASPGSRARRPFARTTSSPSLPLPLSLPVAASLPVALLTPALAEEEEEDGEEEEQEVEEEEEEEEEEKEEEDDDKTLGGGDLPVEGSAFGRHESVARRGERLGTGPKMKKYPSADKVIYGPAQAAARKPAGVFGVLRTRASRIFRSMKPSASEPSLKSKIGPPGPLHPRPQVPDQASDRLILPALPPRPPHNPSAFRIARKPVPGQTMTYGPRGSSLANQSSSRNPDEQGSRPNTVDIQILRGRLQQAEEFHRQASIQQQAVQDPDAREQIRRAVLPVTQTIAELRVAINALEVQSNTTRDHAESAVLAAEKAYLTAIALREDTEVYDDAEGSDGGEN